VRWLELRWLASPLPTTVGRFARDLHPTDAAVLATCGIRRPEWACENTSCCLLLIADSPSEEYNLKHQISHLYTEGTYTVQRIFTIVTWVTRLCLRSLHHCFVAWTKPDTTSLMLLTLTDQARSKSELVAENALLRKPLIILRRQGKRPACTKTDRMLLVLLSRMVRTWKQALVIVQEDDAPAVAPPGLQALLEIQVEGSLSQAKTIPGDYLLDKGDGKGQSPSSEQNGFVVNF
jgi:hypothetical protein